MKTVSILLPTAFLCFASAATAQVGLKVEKVIKLPQVEGRIDHMAFDPARKHLFVAALGNNSVEVIGLEKGEVIKRLSGLHEPQGIAYAMEPDQLFIASGQDGTCKIYSGQSLELLKTVQLGEDADNVRYDPAGGRIYVGDVGLAILDAANGKHLGDIKLPAHPESFQLESHGSRIFVNIPQSRKVVVADRLRQSIVESWPMTEAGQNFPMALDEAHQRLFVGCRKPAKLLVLDTKTGRLITSMEIDGDTDDLFYDSTRKYIYVICGAGFIDVIQQNDPDHYLSRGKIPTAPRARTGLFVPSFKKLFLAVPHREGQPAEIRVYDSQPQ
jgi:DNA-binding beta-propeller fold protein YncE